MPKILFPLNDNKNFLRRMTKALANAVKHGGGATKMEVDINDRLDAAKRALVDAAYLARGWKVLNYRTVPAVDRCYNGRAYLVVEFVGEVVA